ncbi:MAG: cupin domain-containing protein [Anaerolineae bacterium]|nr:cupin domain-containing protein [Anaerolineae bacterium]
MMHIKNTSSITPCSSPTGEVIHEFMGQVAGGSHQHSLAQITLPPGKASAKHYHPVAEESYYILSGHGTLMLGDEIMTLASGDVVAIPANTIHEIRNNTTEDLIFLAVCVPAWTPDCSVYLD